MRERERESEREGERDFVLANSRHTLGLGFQDAAFLLFLDLRHCRPLPSGHGTHSVPTTTKHPLTAGAYDTSPLLNKNDGKEILAVTMRVKVLIIRESCDLGDYVKGPYLRVYENRGSLT